MSARPNRIRSRNRRAPLAALLLMVLALSWQGLVTQTHRHLPAVAPPVSVADSQASGTSTVRSGAPAQSSANCPICRDLTLNAQYLPPTPLSFAAPMLALASVAVAVGAVLALARHTLGWQSRAPPLQH